MIRYIDEEKIQNKKVLIRVDYNVTLLPDFTVANDERIRKTIPTIELLLNSGNKLILISHLGRPQGKDDTSSLKPVAATLQKLLPEKKIVFVEDFTTDTGRQLIHNQNENEILLLENLRFYEGEEKNDSFFVQQLAELADVYVNEAFSISHRNHASIVGIPRLLPSYGGLLLKKETQTISSIVEHPKRPYVVIMGGAKISTKVYLLDSLMGKTDAVIIGGGIANAILKQQGKEIGKSIYEKRECQETGELIALSKEKHTQIMLPIDALTAKDKSDANGVVKKIEDISKDDLILDIGPETCKLYKEKISEAQTIVWNGPMGYFENPAFRTGTDCIYDTVVQNSDAVSLIGGGQTLAAIARKDSLNKITHISTGGGAMLEFIEKGTLPGLTALEK